MWHQYSGRLICSAFCGHIAKWRGFCFSSQETQLAAEAEGLDLTSLLLVLSHQRCFWTDWQKAEQQKQTAVLIENQPLFLQTAVIWPAPQRFTSVNPSLQSFCVSCHIYICLSGNCLFLGEQLSLLLRHPDQPANSKALKVAIIGSPNAGKSTLSNQLLGRKVTVRPALLTMSDSLMGAQCSFLS